MMHVFVHVGICNVSELSCNDDQRIHKQTKVCSPNYSIPSSATHSLLRSSALTAIYAMELRNFDTPRPHLMTLTRVNQCAQSWSSISYAFCVKFQPYKGTLSCTMRDTKASVWRSILIVTVVPTETLVWALAETSSSSLIFQAGCQPPINLRLAKHGSLIARRSRMIWFLKFISSSNIAIA